jgi:transcriptional regulator with GAF, ATPase, and Fis domain
VNCGAIPPDLVESQLFGHEKGAFTGAVAAREGFFEAASGGTLFLDEIGELPLLAQVKLLRALQEGEVVRVGATRPVRLDLRVVAATNRSLIEEVRAARFREDLFYRLAVAVLRLPPLSERPGDVSLIADHLLAQINTESQSEPGFKSKRLSPGARNAIQGYKWPGNVRELFNTLRRAAIWSPGDSIQAEEIREALLESTRPTGTDVLGRPLGGVFDLQAVIADVARHYLARALAEAHGNKSEAARLVGLPSYQTFTNWMERYAVENSGKRLA